MNATAIKRLRELALGVTEGHRLDAPATVQDVEQVLLSLAEALEAEPAPDPIPRSLTRLLENSALRDLLALQERVGAIETHLQPPSFEQRDAAFNLNATHAGRYRERIINTIIDVNASGRDMSTGGILLVLHDQATIGTNHEQRIHDSEGQIDRLIGVVAECTGRIATLEQRFAEQAQRAQDVAAELRGHVEAWSEIGDTSPVLALISVAGAVANALDPEAEVAGEPMYAVCPDCKVWREVVAADEDGFISCVDCGTVWEGFGERTAGGSGESPSSP